MAYRLPLLARVLIILGVLLQTWVSYGVIVACFAATSGDRLQSAMIFGMLFIAIMFIFWGVWHLKRWAWWSSMTLMVLLWPVYSLYSPWMVMFTFVWIIYFSRPRVRVLFLSTKQGEGT